MHPVPLFTFALSLAAPLLASAAAPDEAARFLADWTRWHGERLERLRGPQGWLALSGLQWLEPGANRVEGLPGAFRLEGGQVALEAAAADGWTFEGKPVAARPLASDKDGKPDRIFHGSKAAQVIDRAGRLGLRIWDAESPLRKSFTDIETFPVDLRFRVEARWEAYAAPREVSVPSVIGVPEKELAPGRAHFTLGGKELSLEPVLEGDKLFFVFRDQTAPRETYGGGRFLYAAPAVDGKVILDFNRATNPPCVFTDFATCPLPLPQNMLPLRLEAGEKLWGHGH